MEDKQTNEAETADILPTPMAVPRYDVQDEIVGELLRRKDRYNAELQALQDSGTDEPFENLSPSVQKLFARNSQARSRKKAQIERTKGELELHRVVKGAGYVKRDIRLYVHSASSLFYRNWAYMNSDLRALFHVGAMYVGIQERESVRTAIKNSLDDVRDMLEKELERLESLKLQLGSDDVDLIYDAPAGEFQGLKVYTYEADYAREIFMLLDRVLQVSRQLQWRGDEEISQRMSEMENAVRKAIINVNRMIRRTARAALRHADEREKVLKEEERRENLSDIPALSTDGVSNGRSGQPE